MNRSPNPTRRPDTQIPSARRWSPNSYGSGDPSQRWPGLFGRFFRPVLFIVIGVACMIVNRLVPEGLQLMRLGVTAIIVGVLWVTAVGFALGTLRLVAAGAVVVVGFLLTGVGGDATAEVEANEYRSLRSELQIELNLLRGALTTRAQVAENLTASATSWIEGKQVTDEARTVMNGLLLWRRAVETNRLDASDERALITAYDRRFDQLLTEQFATDLRSTREAVETGWQVLAPGSKPFAEADRAGGVEKLSNDPPKDSLPTDPAPEDAADPTQAEPGGDAADPTQVEPGEDSAEPTQAEPSGEPADPAARNQMDLARTGADSIDATVTQLETLIAYLNEQGLPPEAPIEPPDPAVLARARDSFPPPPAEGTCADSTAVTSNFNAAVAGADVCVVGCGGGDGTCEPMRATRVLLLGFQSQLAALTSDGDVTENQEALVARLDEVRSQITALDDPASINNLAQSGADEVLGDAVRAIVLDGDRPARLGGWGWLILTIAAIIGYRLLEIANDRRSPGPVMVSPGIPTGESDPKTMAATELVRAHLTAANLQEPSPLPGGEAVSSISNSTETAGFDNAAVKFVVSLLQTTAFPRRGVDLVVSTQPAEAGLTAQSNGNATTPRTSSADTNGNSAGANGVERKPRDDEVAAATNHDVEPYRLMVRATNPRSKQLIFSHPFEGETLDEVTLAAAYFAAERLLDAGWVTPSWLVWTSTDGTALRAYREVMIEKQSPPQLMPPVTRPVDGTARQRLRKAVRSSPGTGAALVALSHEAVLEEDFPAALHHLLLARVRHPRFLTVQYRLGVTLSMMACDIEKYWDENKACGTRDLERTNHVHGARDALQDLDRSWRDKTPAPEAHTRLLLERAITELDEVIRSVDPVVILWRCRRQAEREYWLGLLRSTRRRQGLAAAATSARALARRRLLHAEGAWKRACDTLPIPYADEEFTKCDDDNEAAVKRSPDDWIVRYNAACYTAARLDEHVTLAMFYRTARFSESVVQRDLAERRAEEAFDHLRRARYARNGHQLAAEWANADPDLAPLRRYFKDDCEWRARLAGVFQLNRDELDQKLDKQRKAQERPTKKGAMAGAR